MYEKPFGTSGEKFRELDQVVHSVLDEQQVYRIDHFLGKEATQDLHVLRFANGLFDAMWNREHVRAVQIDVPERLGVTDRAEFYDATGAVLDMLVTHLFQVAAEVAMEPPAALSAADLQAAREEVIGSVPPARPGRGRARPVRGLPRHRRRSRARSSTDTFVAARLWIDNERWRGVPFLLRTGKRLAQSHQRVSLILREPDGHARRRAQERQRAELRAQAATARSASSWSPSGPARNSAWTSRRPRIPLAQLRGAEPLPPYVRLIHDVLLGDRSLFTRPDGLAAVWKVADPLLQNRPRVQQYAPGLVGPEAAAELAAPDGWLLGG